MKTRTIRMAVTLHASPAKIFQLLTNASSIRKWSGQKGAVASVEGGKFGMFDGWVRGTVVEFRPGKALASTWLPADWPREAEVSLVRYTFERVKTGTRVTLVHTSLPTRQQRAAHAIGWKEFVFDPLKSSLAQSHH